MKSIVFAGLFGLALALNAPIPRPTDNIANALGNGFSPVPTTAPIIHGGLIKRTSSSGSLLGYYAPDSTCGFVSGVGCKFQPCAAISVDVTDDR
jgi:hypothetical protein